MLNNHSLMWSHYGKDHTGLCIGYRLTHLPKHVGWNGIEYCPAYDHVDDFLAKGGYLVNSISTKTEVWSYEQEVRLFCYKPENQKIHYSSTPTDEEIGCEICEIILGYKMDSEAKQSVKVIVQTINDERKRVSRSEIQIVETVRSKLYELELKEL